MLGLGVLVIVAGAVVASEAVSISEDGFYDTRYNHLDIERILNNKRLVTYYGMCLTGDGPCTPQGTEFKRILPEALRTNCVRCTEKQKRTAYLAIRRLKKEYPKIWQQLQAAWDPTGEYVSTFINTVETNQNAAENVDNEIVTAPDSTVPLPRGMQNSSSSSSTTKTTTTISTTSSTTRASFATKTTDIYNYRTTFRPNRFNLLPRPQDLGKFTANWIGSIGDIGTKVIRTGARIADMVLSGVQASVKATIGRTL